MPWLCLFAFMTGIGGCGAFAGAIKTCEDLRTVSLSSTDRDPAALNWPHSRGTATAFPLAAFGLSALFFSAISSLAFPDNTSDLLLLLSIATFLMTFIGTFFLRVIPTSASYATIPKEERSGSDSSTLLKRTRSTDSKYSAGRVSHEPGTQPETISYGDDTPKDPTVFGEPEGPNGGTEETSSLLSKSSGPGDVPYQNGNAGPETNRDSHHADIRGLALLSRMKFYQLWLMMGLLTGIGLMTIK